MFNKIVFKLNSINGWQRLWLLLSMIFSLIYFFVFFVLPINFNKSLIYSLPFSNEINYESLDFPTYNQLYYSNSLNNTLTFNQAKINSHDWLKEEYSNLIGNTLFLDGVHDGCFGDDLINLIYSENHIFIPKKFTIYTYTNLPSDYLWTTINELPKSYKDSSDCWIEIQVNNPQKEFFLYFIRPLKLATNDESVKIAEFLRTKAENFLLNSRLIWIFKFLFFTLLFSLILYLFGLIFNWIVKGFSINK